ncbi:DNA gyrase subunit A [Vulgatibacter incomptus]|uniref:DNA gyrase subunit A n=1 Tax=Vulgatibacter incomptus TaxID=1391653 RepID=UPI0009E9181A|nr:DNA gyrase subunit A [Vulgatibacter incomptus]
MSADTTLPPPPGAPSANTLPINIEDEMRRSYLDYSMSVIIGRALPDVRDGLKPVHRRILYAMFDEGLLHNRKFSKCAGTVGEVLKKYHPHGDASVYDALVRLAQDWNMRYLLVDGQGNFGSIDGDSAAAYRYTEARLTKLAEQMLADIDKDTVDFGPNFDDATTEPLVLPTRFPNLLVNGSAGIAVGMATNIPPHNMGEVLDACLHLIDQPRCSIQDLIEYVPGPDFPTGGIINGRNGILEAYLSGRGSIRVRAKYEIERDEKRDRETIIIRELPYQVNKARLIERIAELVKEKKIEGISDIRDESDREEKVRIVIEVKRDAIGQIVVNNLFQQTSLESTFGVTMLAIDGNVPRILNLKEMLERFVAHRRDVVTRRTKYELRKAEERLHLVEGLVVAQDLIDLVVALIRKAKDPEEARWGLQNILSPSLYEHERFVDLPRIDPEVAKAGLARVVERVQRDEPKFAGLSREYLGSGFSELQAKAILDMRLAKLTNMERDELVAELVGLVRDIGWFKEILGSELTLLGVIKRELTEVRDQFSDKRRTEIQGEAGVITREDLIAEEDMAVTLSHNGYVKRNPISLYRAQRRGGRGKSGAGTREEDFIESLFVASTHAYMLVFTTKGKLYWLKVHEIPQAGRTALGRPIVNLVQFQEGETLAKVLPVRHFEEGKFVVLVTRKGIIKKTDLMAYSNIRSNGIIALGIEDGDELVAAMLTDGSAQILVSTANGMAIRFDENDVRAMGRAAYGVKAMTLDDDDWVVGADVVSAGAAILTVTENGFGKRTEENEYRLQNRGGKGLITIKTTDRNGKVAGACQVADDDEVMLITNAGTLIRMAVNEISVIGRNTQGVRLITVGSEQEKVVSVARLADVEKVDEGDVVDVADEAGEP